MDIVIKYPGSHHILLGSPTARIGLLLLFAWLRIRSETLYYLVTKWLHPNRMFVGLRYHLLPKGLTSHWRFVGVAPATALVRLFARRRIMPRYGRFELP